MRYFTTDAKRYRAECYADSQLWESAFSQVAPLLPVMEAAKFARGAVTERRKDNPFPSLLIVPKGYNADEVAKACGGTLVT